MSITGVLRRNTDAARLLTSRVRIPLMAWIFFSYVCCVLCSQRPLRRADHSLRGIPLDMLVSNCVLYKNLKNEAA